MLRAHPVALGRDVVARDRGATPPVGRSSVHRIEIVVVFPAPLGPRKPNSSPGCDRERDVVDRGEVAEAAHEALHLDGGRRCAHDRLSSRRRVLRSATCVVAVQEAVAEGKGPVEGDIQVRTPSASTCRR